MEGRRYPLRKTKARDSLSSSSSRRVAGEDRLSNLSDDILHHIFSKFDVKQVIQTCILSKRWRYFWTTLPTLYFDSNIFFNGSESRNENHPLGKFDEFVTKVLGSRCKNSSIKTLSVFSDNPCDCTVSNIQSWVQNAVESHIQNLYLQFFKPNFRSLVLPPSFFTCQSLTRVILVLTKRLKGSRIQFPLPDSIDLPLLKDLTLQSVSCLSTNFLDQIFLGCPLLKKLEIRLCEFDKSRSLVITSDQLKQLVISMCRPEGDKAVQVTIMTPNLTSFTCCEWHGTVYLLKNFTSLENACLDMRFGHVGITGMHGVLLFCDILLHHVNVNYEREYKNDNICFIPYS